MAGQEKGSNTGIILGGLVLLVLIAGAAMYFVFGKSTKPSTTTTTTETTTGLSSLASSGGLGWLGSLLGGPPQIQTPGRTPDAPGSAGR